MSETIRCCRSCDAPIPEDASRSRKFCSNRCREREKYRRRNGTVARWTGKVCSCCGSIFDDEPRPGYPRKSDLCQSCEPTGQRRPRKPPEAKSCPMCAETFETRRSFQVYCSKLCANRARGRKRRSRVDIYNTQTWRNLRARVLAEEPDCGICGKPIDPVLVAPDPQSGTGDHIVPLAYGGAPFDRLNVRAAHLGCNSARGNRTRKGTSNPLCPLLIRRRRHPQVWIEMPKPPKKSVAPAEPRMPRTHCTKGHEFTPENTYEYRRTHTTNGGEYLQRICRTCTLSYQNERNAQKRAERATQAELHDDHRDRRLPQVA